MKNKKSLGQNWLKNRSILEEIAESAVGDVVDGNGAYFNKIEARICVEIGPGLGFLTTSLLRRFDQVVAVEFDDRLAENLPKSFPGKNLKVVNGDILEYDFGELREPFVVVGNIPYYITSPIIRKVLTLHQLPERVVLLVQKEVAERIVSKRETLLSLFVKNRATVLAGAVVPRDEFTPPPKVDSQIIIMEPHQPIVGDEVLQLIQKGFSNPRKKLIHNLSGLKSKEELINMMNRCGISVDARPGDLHLVDWQKIYNFGF